MKKLSILAFSIFPLTNLGKLKIDDERFEFTAPGNIKNPETVHDYLNKKCVDILILNIFMDDHPGSIQAGLSFVKRARQHGFKGLIIGTSNHHENEHKITKAILNGFDMYVSDEILSEKLTKIASAFANIRLPEEESFVLNQSEYNCLVRDAGKYLFKDFAKTFCRLHKARWVIVSQDKEVIDYHPDEEAPSKMSLMELMNKEQKYLFLFSRSEFFNKEKRKIAA